MIESTQDIHYSSEKMWNKSQPDTLQNHCMRQTEPNIRQTWHAADGIETFDLWPDLDVFDAVTWWPDLTQMNVLKNIRSSKVCSEKMSGVPKYVNSLICINSLKYSSKISRWQHPQYSKLYIGWEWRNFFISAVFRHFVGQALRYVCYSDVSRRHFLNKIAIVRTFS